MSPALSAGLIEALTQGLEEGLVGFPVPAGTTGLALCPLGRCP